MTYVSSSSAALLIIHMRPTETHFKGKINLFKFLKALKDH